MPQPRFLAPSILLLIAVARSTAAGQTIPSPYTFIEHSQAWAAFVGKSDFNPGQLGLGPGSATTIGGRYAIAFGPMNLDVDGTMFRSTRDVLDVARPVDDRSLGRSDMNILLVDARLRLNLTGPRAWHGIQPFIAFGGGVVTSVFTDRALEVSSEMPLDQWYEFGKRFAATIAGGTNFHVSSKISLRVDGVMNLWKIAMPVGWQTIEADPFDENPESEWISGKTIRVGAAWRF